ncbi:MAG: hypothetical protein ACTSRI_10230 [Promethearchaeota archaeon]
MVKKNQDNLWLEIPSHAWVALARRGMEKISLDQCFLKGCENQDIKMLEPLKKEEYDDEKKHVKKIHIKCKKCGGIFQLELITLKKVARPTQKGKQEKDKLDNDSEDLSMGIVNALDETGKNIGNIGFF